jgi:alpha-beta hydrolase superfamily lysophospholipase
VKRDQHIVETATGHRSLTLDRPTDAPAGLVVCAHGLTGDKSGPAELLARWSAGLAEAGLATVRFDFRGSGDSSGAFPATTFSEMVDDFAEVWQWARDQVGELPGVAAGISTGGAVAAGAGTRLPGLAGLLLISSDLVDGAGPLPASAVPLRAGEFHLGRRLLADRAALPVRPLIAALERPVRLVYGNDDVEVASNVDGFLRLGIDPVPIASCGHLIETRQARAELLDATAEFVLSVVKRATGELTG